MTTGGGIINIAQVSKREVFESAFNEHWEALYCQAIKKVQSEEIAKDLVQEVFIVLWNNLEQAPESGRLLPYLYGILRNKVLQLYEKDEVRLRYAVKVSRLGEQEELSSFQHFVGKELQGIITSEVAKMPLGMRKIYQLRKDEELSINEISQLLSISPQTVKNQLQNAYHRLRARVRNYDSSLVSVVLILLCFLYF